MRVDSTRPARALDGPERVFGKTTLFTCRENPVDRHGRRLRCLTAPMRFLIPILLTVCMAVQPMLAQPMVGCGPSAAPSASVVRRSCCGSDQACMCKRDRHSGCGCELAPADRPAAPDKATPPAGQSSWLAPATLVPAVVLLPHAASDRCPHWGDNRAPRLSIDSIQSLLCVWQT